MARQMSLPLNRNLLEKKVPQKKPIGRRNDGKYPRRDIGLGWIQFRHGSPNFCNLPILDKSAASEQSTL